MPVGQTSFQNAWKLEFPWVEKDKKSFFARCTLCKNKSFTFETMGRTALKSHAKSVKHKQLEDSAKNSVPIASILSVKTTGSTFVQESSLTTANLSITLETPVYSVSSVEVFRKENRPSDTRLAKNLLDFYAMKDSTIEAEILWCLETVMNHTSLRSAESNVLLFQRMFPDSDIAEKMKLHKDKIAYSI